LSKDSIIKIIKVKAGMEVFEKTRSYKIAEFFA